jgi:filamentous hemagglutinin
MLKIPGEEGYFDVIGHGTPTTVSGMSADEVEQIIRQQPAWQGQDVRLLSCSTGGCPVEGGAPIAQQLADFLGVGVKAPTSVFLVSGREI